MNQSKLISTDIEDADYIRWLLSLVGVTSSREINERWSVFKCMNKVEFTPYLKNDLNRVKDAMHYRSQYLQKACDSGSCTVLELLVSFSIRIEDDYLAEDYLNPNYKKIFFELLENLVPKRERHDPDRIIMRRLHTFVDGKYDPVNGKGGLFPCTNDGSYRDLRAVSLWDQMLLYISQKH